MFVCVWGGGWGGGRGGGGGGGPHMKAALPPSRLLSLAVEPGLPHRHMIRPHLLMKKHLTSTASSSSSTATRRTPAMMPVDSADSSPRSAGEEGTGGESAAPGVHLR